MGLAWFEGASGFIDVLWVSFNGDQYSLTIYIYTYIYKLVLSSLRMKSNVFGWTPFGPWHVCASSGGEKCDGWL